MDTRRRKKWIFIIVAIVIVVAAIITSVFLTCISPLTEEQNRNTEKIESLKYNAIESDGTKYYPISKPLYLIPVSLPPQDSYDVYIVTDGKADYSQIHSAQGFVDDYDKNYLYFDELVFKKE